MMARQLIFCIPTEGRSDEELASLAWEAFQAWREAQRRPLDGVLDDIDRLVDWQMHDSPAARAQTDIER